LNQSVDQPWTFEQRRRVVETLVDGITVKEGDDGEPVVRVRYRFSLNPAFENTSSNRSISMT
jgi:hypothetical protein